MTMTDEQFSELKKLIQEKKGEAIEALLDLLLFDTTMKYPSRWEIQKDWEIRSDGTLYNKEQDYTIEGDRLNEDDWFIHMMKKSWVNLNSFIPAYFEACRRRNLQSLNIITYYN